jgi:hypothetical protein
MLPGALLSGLGDLGNEPHFRLGLGLFYGSGEK